MIRDLLGWPDPELDFPFSSCGCRVEVLTLREWPVVSGAPTNLETSAEYGERFQIEKGCLDDKSGLSGLEDSKRRDAASFECLILIIAVATLLLVSEGLQIVQQGVRRTTDLPWNRALSELKLG
jgi:hypothetical protein